MNLQKVIHSGFAGKALCFLAKATKNSLNIILIRIPLLIWNLFLTVFFNCVLTLKNTIGSPKTGSGIKGISCRFFCMLLSIVTMIASSIGFYPVFAEENVSENERIVSDEYIQIGDMSLKQSQTLTDNGDGTFTYLLSLSSNMNRKDENQASDTAKDSYFTATHDGYYLVELWGGDGGNGQNTSYGNGGTGGKGGYVYGVIHLTAGQTLFYTLGGNGGETVSTDSGGGVNGDGGSHGEIGRYTVGGGGGYSAIYLFEDDEFENKYLDENKNISSMISEEDRTSKYIMIAGGGGGGGAGNGFAIGASPIQTPDGGDGGSVGGNFGELSGESYDVSGVFFAGEDGLSSGISTEYVGHGGTNKPGEISDTIITVFDVQQPNDWNGTYNEELAGGAGGSGNMRGGSGGAGFCGGSGGIMESLLYPANVGGGGGGSSFISDTVRYQLTDDEENKLHTDNPSQTGGAVQITYLGQDDNPIQTTFTLSGTVSKYFEIREIEVSGEQVSLPEGNDFHLDNLQLDASDISEAASFSVSVTVSPKSDFAGGNGVPVFDNAIQLKDSSNSTDIAVKEECSAVNVPLNFTVQTHNHVTNNKDQQYTVSSLYTDNYEGVRDSLTTNWQYAFIQSIGNYTVTDSSGNAYADSDIITASSTQTFLVSFNVVVGKDKIAAVGTAVEDTVFSKNATITFFTGDNGSLNDNTVTYTKTLSYQEETDRYELSLNVKADTSASFTTVREVHKTYNDGSTIDWAIISSGYYLVMLWGGNGGDGESATSGGAGGTGGTGGLVYAVVRLEKGESITVNLGLNGNDGNDGGLLTNVGGSGGQYSSVMKNTNNTYFLIAGGGGGGGGAHFQDNGGNGFSPNDTIESLLEVSNFSDIFSGKDGDTVNVVSSSSNGGKAGKNYINPDLSYDVNELSADSKTKYESLTASPTRPAGGEECSCFSLIPLQLDENSQSTKDEVKQALQGYSLEAEISDYFEVNKDDLGHFEVIGNNNSDQADENAISDFSCSFIDKRIEINNINPYVMIEQIPISSSADGSQTETWKGSVDFTITIVLKVRDGFLGGNDVPVLEEGSAMSLNQSDESLSITPYENADYANVEINNYDYDESKLTVNEVTYVKDGTSVQHSELFQYESHSADYTWEDDYVSIIDPTQVNREYAPSVDTEVPVEIGIKPKTETPQKASVGVLAVGSTASKNAVIHVKYQVFYQLENITTTDIPDESKRYLISPYTEYSAQLIVADDVIRPSTITVSVGNSVLSEKDYNYNPESGEFLIPADKVTDNITIQASAEEQQEFTIYFIYEESPGGEMKTIEETYAVNADISNNYTKTYFPTNFPGYTFTWDWQDENLTQMPKRDVYVIGQYVANSYTLTINYVDENGEFLQTSTDEILFGQEYRVISPEIPGYQLADPNQIIIQGIMEKDITITVKYKKSTGEVIIYYIYRDSNTSAANPVTLTGSVGDSYSNPSPNIPGYSASEETVSGTYSGTGETKYVYYDPKSFSVTFNADGGNCTETSRTVLYNNVYGFDGSSDSYKALPKPIKVGYKFAGWYTEDGTLVTETTKVEILENIILTAKWTAEEYVLTIKYLFENNVEAFPSDQFSIAVDSEYTYPAKQLEGYTPNPDTVTGVMPAQNKTVTIRYLKNSFLVTIYYQYEDGTTAAPDYQATVERNGSATIDSPNVIGHTPDFEAVSITNITQDVEKYVIYSPNSYTLTINYQDEDNNSLYGISNYSASVVFGHSYSVESPVVSGMYPSLAEVSGIMGASDETITVTYYKNEPPEIISVEIEWGDLSFNASYDDWNPETHEYTSAEVSPVSPGSNYVKVTNRSNIGMTANITSQIDHDYENVFSDYFTETNQSDSEHVSETSFSLGTTENVVKQLWLWLKETSANALAGSSLGNEMRPIGTCNVTVSKTEKDTGGE